MNIQLVIQILIDATALGLIYAVVGLSIGLVFGVMRLVNFAHADLITIGAYALILPSTADVAAPGLANLPVVVLVPTLIILVGLIALLIERIVFRPLRNQDPVTLLIASFALSFTIQHIIQVVYTSKPKAMAFGSSLIDPIQMFGLRVAAIQIVTAGVCTLALLALGLLLKRTTIGLQMRAAAENFSLARLRKVKADRVIATSFAISGGLAALTALLFVAQLGTLDPAMGVLPVVYAFFGAVIGGMGSLPGSAVGAFILGFASQLLQSILPASLVPFRDAFIFAAVILILLIRPQGLLGAAPQRSI